MVGAATNLGYNIRIRHAVVVANNGACFYCGERAAGADHIVPSALKGSDEPENLIASCGSCNHSKGGRRLKLEDEQSALRRAAELAPLVLEIAGIALTTVRRGKTKREGHSRKSVSLSQSMWSDIAEIKNANRMATEAEALRLIINAGLKALKDQKL
jgi:HNH endonuclease